jgi:hypothetical protein
MKKIGGTKNYVASFGDLECLKGIKFAGHSRIKFTEL